MRRILVLALYISVLLGLCVVHSQSSIWRWNAGLIGFHRSWVGMGGLLYFVPLVVMMALVFVALWLIGRWFGRIDR
jgi:hypothetical protein